MRKFFTMAQAVVIIFIIALIGVEGLSLFHSAPHPEKNAYYCKNGSQSREAYMRMIDRNYWRQVHLGRYVEHEGYQCREMLQPTIYAEFPKGKKHPYKFFHSRKFKKSQINTYNLTFIDFSINDVSDQNITEFQNLVFNGSYERK